MIDDRCKVCTECGSHLPETATLGPMTVVSDPPILFFEGKPVDGFTGFEKRILYSLARQKGQATGLSLSNTGTDYCSDNVVKVRISQMRRKFEARGIPIQIKNIWGWGYAILFNGETLADRYGDRLMAA